MVHDPCYVGREFVRQYNLILNRSPENMYRFYKNSARFDHDDIDAKVRHTISAHGRHGIRDVMKERMVKYRHQCTIVHSVDTLETIKDGLIVQVVGEISFNESPMRPFSQTFMLYAHSPFQYFVANDIFRYTDFSTVVDCNKKPKSDCNQWSDSSFMDDGECYNNEDAVIDMQTINLKGMMLKEDSHPLTRRSLMKRAPPQEPTQQPECIKSWSDEMEECEEDNTNSHHQMFRDKCILTIGNRINPNIQFDDAKDSACGTLSTTLSSERDGGSYNDDVEFYHEKYEDDINSPYIDVVGLDENGAQFYVAMPDMPPPIYGLQPIYEHQMHTGMEYPIPVQDDECAQFTQPMMNSTEQQRMQVPDKIKAKKERAQRKKQKKASSQTQKAENGEQPKDNSPEQPKTNSSEQSKRDSPAHKVDSVKQPKENCVEQPKKDSSRLAKANSPKELKEESPMQPKEDGQKSLKPDSPKQSEADAKSPKWITKSVDTADKATETEFTPKSEKSTSRKNGRGKNETDPDASPEVKLTSTGIQCDSPTLLSMEPKSSATYADLVRNPPADRLDFETIEPIEASGRSSAPFTRAEKPRFQRGASFRNDRDKYSRGKSFK